MIPFFFMFSNNTSVNLEIYEASQKVRLLLLCRYQTVSTVFESKKQSETAAFYECFKIFFSPLRALNSAEKGFQPSGTVKVSFSSYLHRDTQKWKSSQLQH